MCLWGASHDRVEVTSVAVVYRFYGLGLCGLNLTGSREFHALYPFWTSKPPQIRRFDRAFRLTQVRRHLYTRHAYLGAHVLHFDFDVMRWRHNDFPIKVHEPEPHMTDRIGYGKRVLTAIVGAPQG